MSMLHSSSVDAVLQLFASTDDPIIEEMEVRAAATGFPTVGPEVGSFLRWLVRAADVTDVFECGSGFGYSTYWMAGAMSADASIVLTEIDRDELDDAKDYFSRSEIEPSVRFERGDALEILADEPGPFDLVVLDHENERYAEGFQIASERLAEGGIIVADNVIHSWEFSPSTLYAVLDGDREPPNASLAGVVDYYEHLRDLDGFEHCLLPIGEGLAMSIATE